MWSIPLIKVRSALRLRIAQMRARTAMQDAIQLAGDNEELTLAIRLAVCEAENFRMAALCEDRCAISGPLQVAI